MPIDERIANKSSEDMTQEDVSELMDSPSNDERPLVEPGVFDEKQPARPIYKNIPLKFAVASIFVLGLMIPAMRLFSGNLLSNNNSATVASVEETEETETEAEKEQRLIVEENADLKRELALQNQAFTAKEIEDAEGTEDSTLEQAQPTSTVASPPTPRPAPVARPVAAVAPRPAPTPRPAPVARASVRPTPAPRAVAPARTSPAPVVRASARSPEPKPLNLAQIAAAGNYGEMPSIPTLPPATAAITQPVRTTSQIPTGIMVANRATQVSRSGSIPVSVRRQNIPAELRAVIAESTETVKRPIPRVMRDSNAATTTAVPGAVLVAQADIALDAASTYEAQRELIMGETAAPASTNTVQLPARIVPGSAADLEVTTAITWASDLPSALGAVTLTSPLINDGMEVIPEGTELIVQIGSLSASGAVSLDVVAMVLPGTAEATAINIPAGAVSILAVDGGYPVAKAEQSSERQLQAIDRQQALLSAMGSVGDFLNRPERETNVIGLGGSSSSREYGSGSFLGSVLSGAANGMLRSRAARLGAEADKIASRPTIWSIEPGRQLQLFVTQEISL